MVFEGVALLAQSKNENAKVRLNTAFQAVRIHLALPYALCRQSEATSKLRLPFNMF